MFPLSEKNHKMETRKEEKYKVEFANTDRKNEGLSSRIHAKAIELAVISINSKKYITQAIITTTNQKEETQLGKVLVQGGI
jgi:hypothetical protein